MSTRVIDETTLRIYFPMKPEVTAKIPSIFASIPSMFTTAGSHDNDKDINNNQGPPMLLYTNNFTHTMIT